MLPKSLRDVHVLRWLAPLWVSLLLLWAAQTFFLGEYDDARHSGGRDPATLHDPATIARVMLLMAVHIGVYVLGLARKPQRWWFLVYSGVQGVLACGIGLLSQSWTITLLLFLPLMAEAVGVLRLPRVIFAVLAVYLLCLCLTLQLLGSWQVVRGILVVILPIVAFFGLVVFLFLQQVRARERAQALVRELESAHRQLAASIARVEELTLLTERQRMARELHDTLAQGLAGLILQLEAAGLHLQQQHVERATVIVHQAQARARGALANARCAIDDLRAVPADIVATVQEEIDRFVAATGIACGADIAALAQLPASCHEHAIYAIAEGLANVARHAQAHHVWVEVQTGIAAVAVVVRDDGVGFEPARVAGRAGHYGLLGVRERARLAGGDFAVESAPGIGTTLHLRLPSGLQEEVYA